MSINGSRILKGGLFMFALICLGAPLVAHQGKKHLGGAAAPPAKRDAGRTAGSRRIALQRVNALYVENVRPVFKKKCFDCHGAGNPLPWYSRIPGPKQLIERDIRAAKEHIDMTRDFPFGGHGSPMEDLNSLEKVAEAGTMPPLRYRIMHRGSGLTEDEIRAVRAWVGEGRKLLAETAG